MCGVNHVHMCVCCSTDTYLQTGDSVFINNPSAFNHETTHAVCLFLSLSFSYLRLKEEVLTTSQCGRQGCADSQVHCATNTFQPQTLKTHKLSHKKSFINNCENTEATY